MLRRQLLTGLLAAPLVVRDYGVLMPVRSLLLTGPFTWYVKGTATGSGKIWSDPTNLATALRLAGAGDHIIIGPDAMPVRSYRRAFSNTRER